MKEEVDEKENATRSLSASSSTSASPVPGVGRSSNRESEHLPRWVIRFMIITECKLGLNVFISHQDPNTSYRSN